MLSKAQVVEARNLFKDLYQDKCTIYEKTKVTRADHSTVETETAVLSNEPCRIDFDTENPSTTENQVAVAPQTITLFIRPDVTIKPGTKIRVTYTDLVSSTTVTKDYSRAGEPAVFNTHQEVALTIFTKYA